MIVRLAGSLLGLGLLLLPAISSAQTFSPTEADLLPRVIDSVCLDKLHETNGCETAMLLVSDTDSSLADLLIWTDRRSPDGARPLAVIRNAAFNGGLFGMSPWLEEGPNGSLRLHSQQIGIGRDPWEQTVTIVFRDEAFVIAGFTYSTYDRLDLTTFFCDHNLRTGTYSATINEDDPLEGTVAPEPIALSDWSADRPFPEPCAALLSDYFSSDP